MGLYGKLKNYKVGNAKAMKLPKNIKKSEESSYAGNRILIVDPRGEIDCDSLLHFFEAKVEPEFWKWYKKWKNRHNSRERLNMVEKESKQVEIKRSLEKEEKDERGGSRAGIKGVA